MKGENRPSMAQGPPSGVSTPLYMIFTDLDGTLLDHDNYGWEDAMPALDLCKRLDVPVVLVSSKTRAEMNLLRRRLLMSSPFISENGGGVYFPSEAFDDPSLGASFDQGLWKWSLGLEYEKLIKGLNEIREELHWNIKGFSDMSNEEIRDLTGLDLAGAHLATMREYSEPFMILDRPLPDRRALFEAATRKNLMVATGGRFYHLQGRNYDKGRAMEKVTNWYRKFYGEVVTIALGDSQNDFSMLKYADVPVLIKSRENFSFLKRRIPRLTITSERGPRGWNSAILGILGKEEETGGNGG